MAAGDFLTIAGQAIPVQRTGAGWQPDGPNGKRRWTVTTGPLDLSAVTTLRTAIGVGSGAEADRSVNGTLLTDRPLVSCTGLYTGATAATALLCEVTITEAPFRHHRDSLFAPSTPSVRQTLTLVLREA